MGKTRRRRAYHISWPKQQETSGGPETAVSGQESACSKADFNTWLKEILHSKGADDLFGLISEEVKKRSE
jgi:hypothetical protein